MGVTAFDPGCPAGLGSYVWAVCSTSHSFPYRTSIVSSSHTVADILR